MKTAFIRVVTVILLGFSTPSAALPPEMAKKSATDKAQKTAAKPEEDKKTEKPVSSSEELTNEEYHYVRELSARFEKLQAEQRALDAELTLLNAEREQMAATIRVAHHFGPNDRLGSDGRTIVRGPGK